MEITTSTSVAVAVADGDDDDRSTPLLSSPRLPISTSSPHTSEILPYPSSADPLPKPAATNPSQRLASLDVFRGLTVALMILADDAGGAFPEVLNHAPWFGVTLADFVMPMFLFGVGISVALVFKKTSNKLTATGKVMVRTIKLFFLGLLLQGGYFHGRNHLTYGVDLERIRWLGILQRISIGYFIAAMSEIWLVGNILVDSPSSYVKKYYIEWILVISLSSMYFGLLYGVYVPNWEFEVADINSSLSVVKAQTVQCGLRGSLGPPCNAAGLIDRLILGEKHVYSHPVYKRTKECSINSPASGPLPADSPVWCHAPFDPEGLLSSLMAAVTCFAGLHFGHLIVHFKNNTERLLLWSTSSLLLLLSGFIVHMLGMPFSKPLYTFSYMLLTTGTSGFLLTLIYYIVDIKNFRKPSSLLQWMGMNALIVFVLSASELFPIAIQGFYWRSPTNNLVNITESLLQTVFRSERWGTLMFVLLEVLFWCLFAGFLHMKGIYVKL